MDGSGCSSMSQETVHVKEESECANSAEWWGVSEAAARAGLYADHAINGDLVLGPEVLQQPDVLFTGFERTHVDRDHSRRGSGHWDHTYAKRECPPVEVSVKVECVKEEPEWEAPGRVEPALRDCCVRLERIPALEARLGRGTADQKSICITHVAEESEIETEYQSNPKPSTEEETFACAICRKRFALKSHLLEHVVVHIHTPPSPEQERSGPGADIARVPEGAVRAEPAPRPRGPREPQARRTAGRREMLAIVRVSSEKQLHKCDICGKRFALKSQMIQHVADIHSPASPEPEEAGRGGADNDAAGAARPLARGRRPAPSPHALTHTGGKPYSCEICTKRFIKLWYLNVHRRIHTGEKPFSCEICSKQFRTSGNLKSHRWIHMDEKPFSCEICRKQFIQLGDLKVHRRVHTGEKPYSCEICTKRFIKLWYLNVHRRIHTGEKPFSCEICSKQFRTSGGLTSHRRIHTDERPFSCEICTRQFRTSGELKSHRRVHTGEKPFSCEICTKQFRTSGELKLHRQIHTGEKPFSCEICTKQFRTSGELKLHRQIHTGEKPFSCEICAKQFRTLKLLKSHRRSHTGEKPFSCEICTKKFRHSSNLNRHRLIHTGEKPYSCEVCAKQFTHSSNLNAHRNIHTGEKPYSCEVCAQQFRYTSGLRGHRLIHTHKEKTTYLCDLCKKRFIDKSNLVRHIRNHSRNSEREKHRSLRTSD